MFASSDSCLFNSIRCFISVFKEIVIADELELDIDELELIELEETDELELNELELLLNEEIELLI